MREYGAAVCFGVIIVGLFLAPRGVGLPVVPAYAAGSLVREFQSGTMLLGGDIMLGREVERLMDTHGADYPFEGITALVSKADIAFGNFEAAVPAVHHPTPNHDLTLSVATEYVTPLAEHGFGVVSLANNHSYDFGRTGLSHTRAVCVDAGLECVGDPNEVSEWSTRVVNVGTTRVGVLALHAVDRKPDLNDVERAVRKLGDESDIQIVYIHWGVEYEPHHSESQERLAYALIDMDVDAVIGHHPHVVEDVEIYEGKPIFYSLGNLIFDQYIDDSTETGLMVQLAFAPDTVTYTLIPVTSLESPSQPRLMDVDGKNAYVEELFSRSEGLDGYISGSSLIVPRADTLRRP